MMNAGEWKSRIFELVKDISDADYQRRSWFGIGPEVDSPDEMFCALFDDLMFDEFLERHASTLSEAQLRAARRLQREMDEFAASTPGHLEAKAVIDDPRWGKIRDAAKSLLEA